MNKYEKYLGMTSDDLQDTCIQLEEERDQVQVQNQELRKLIDELFNAGKRQAVSLELLKLLVDDYSDIATKAIKLIKNNPKI